MAVQTDDAKEHELTEKMYHGMGTLFYSLQDEYKTVEKDDDDTRKTTGKSKRLDYLVKIAGSMAFTAQTIAGLSKAYHQEKRLTDIEKRLEKIPPEIIAEYLKQDKQK